MNLPDLIRARRAWLTPQRLVAGGVMTTAVGAVAALTSVGAQAGELLTGWVLLLQTLILFFYGVPAAVNDFVEEHRNNTWDMLRLTPLTAAEIVAGRLAASTSYAVYLAATLAPWALFAQTLQSSPGYLGLAVQWTALSLGFAATASLGIAAAAFSSRVEGGRMGNSGMAIGGLGCLITGYALGMFHSRSTVNLLVGTVPVYAALGGVLALAAFWGSVAAVRTVGRLLSERQTPWAVPAFMASLWGALALWVPPGRGAEVFDTLCITAPALVALLASVAEGEDREDWKAKFRSALRRGDAAALAPAWATAWGTLVLLAGLTFALKPDASRVAAMVVCFLARDLFLIGTLRTFFKRNVETASMALLGGLYILPVMYGFATDSASSLYWAVPMEAAKTGFLANVLPAFLHAAAAGTIFLTRVNGFKAGKLLR